MVVLEENTLELVLSQKARQEGDIDVKFAQP
jgi:hypothetical protein